MQEELESARPLLAQAAKDTLATMEQLQVLLLDSPTVSICPPLTAHTDCRAWGGVAELARNRALSASTRASDEFSTVGIYTEQHCQGEVSCWGPSHPASWQQLICSWLKPQPRVARSPDSCCC